MIVDPQRVHAVLHRVMDPCSVFNGADVDVVELGLIDDVAIEDGVVDITLLLTEPTCLFFFDMAVRIEEEVGALPGVSEVRVHSRSDELWTPERMQEHARQRLEQRRASRLVEFGLPRPVGQPGSSM